MRNPFEHFSFGTPKPKAFSMGNQGRGDNEIFLGGRKTYGMPPPPQSAAPPEKRQPSSEWDTYLSEMNDIYNKEGEAAGAYRQHMETVPQYQTPSKWGKFGAALVGGMEGLNSGPMAGFQAGQEVAAAPYRRAMDEWGVKEQALGRNAEMEDKASNRKLQYMKEVRAVRDDEKEANRWMKTHQLAVDKEENDEAQRSAERDHWKTQGWKTRFDEKGNEVAYHPATGEERVLGASSKVKDWELEGARGDIARTGNRISAGIAETGRKRLGLAERTETRLAGREGRYENPSISASEQATARSSALTRASIERPDWAEFVSPEGGVQAPKESSGFWGGMPDTTKSDNFKLFMKRVEEIEKGIFSTRRSLGPQEEEPFEY